MSNISYSTVGFTDRDIESALDNVAAAGFVQTEISGQDAHIARPLRGEQLSTFRTRLSDRGLKARTVHAPMRRNVLGAPDETWRQEVVDVLADHLRFAANLESGEVIIHPVPNPIFVPEGDDPAIARRINDAVYPFLDMQELKPLVDNYPAEQLGLVIDTGHAWTMKKDPSVEIQLAGSRLQGTHLQDVDYDNPNDNHWVPTHGGLDWSAIRGALAKVNYSGPWTFEVSRGRQNETPEQLASLTYQVARSWGL